MTSGFIISLCIKAVMAADTFVGMFLCVFVSIPAAYDSLARQRKVEEGLTHFEREGVFECLSIYDERQFILLPQRVTQ